MKHADLIDPGNIVVRGGDPDIAIILSWNAEKLENSHLWYDFRADDKNSCEYIDITEIAKNIKIIKTLPGIFAFTRNDYALAFFKKGKMQPIQLMQKNEKFVDTFTNLGDFPLNTDKLDVLEKFTCYLYGHIKQNDVHEVIKLHFEEKTKPNCIEIP